MHTVTLCQTNNDIVTLRMSDKGLRELKSGLAKCFYDNEGRLRPEPVGEVVILSENNVCLFRAQAKTLYPFVGVDK